MSHYILSMSGSHKGPEKRSSHQHRKGKTLRDHKSGAWARCFQNKAARASWQNDGTKRESFSSIAYTCNGKRNRFKASNVI